MVMNQNELYLLLNLGMVSAALLIIICWQFRRIKELEKDTRNLMLQWQAWAACKLEDFPTARLMAGLAKSPPVTPLPEPAGAKENKTNLTIEQSAG